MSFHNRRYQWLFKSFSTDSVESRQWRDNETGMCWLTAYDRLLVC